MSDLLRRQIEKVIAGDRHATGSLYDQFSPKLFRRLRARYTPLGLDAEELLHDAFVFFLQHDARVLQRLLDRHSDLSKQTVHNYLWDLACGTASNQLRSRKRATLVPLNSSVLHAEDNTEQTNVTQDVLTQLDHCLSGKNTRVYLYFKLRYVDGLEPAEICQATGWSRKTTYKLKQAFSAALHDCAQRIGIEP